MDEHRVYVPQTEADYEKWMRQHPHGYVINASKTHAVPMVWHRVHCHHIRPDGSTLFVEGRFQKACSMYPCEVAKWAKSASQPEALTCCPDCRN